MGGKIHFVLEHTLFIGIQGHLKRNGFHLEIKFPSLPISPEQLSFCSVNFQYWDEELAKIAQKWTVKTACDGKLSHPDGTAVSNTSPRKHITAVDLLNFELYYMYLNKNTFPFPYSIASGQTAPDCY